MRRCYILNCTHYTLLIKDLSFCSIIAERSLGFVTLQNIRIKIIHFIEEDFFWYKYSGNIEGGIWYGKTRFASYELRITNYKLRVKSLNAQMETPRCYELRVQIDEFKITGYQFRSTNYEFQLTSYDFKSRVASKSINSKMIKSMKTEGSKP